VASYAPETIALVLVIAAIAGVIRGITGFGGALLMAPPFALILGAKLTVPVVLLLEGLVALPMTVQNRALVRWPVMMPMTLAALAAAPFGTYLLVSADPLTLRRAIAATVIVFSMLMLGGWRYAGRQRTATGASLGALSGAMASATGIGGPPVILYLLAGPDPIQNTRANLTFFICAVAIGGLAMMALAGAFDARALWITAAATPGYYLGIVAGSRLFSRFDDTRFRQLTLALMLVVSIGILLA
jgi:uncharacterized protein